MVDFQDPLEILDQYSAYISQLGLTSTARKAHWAVLQQGRS
jgi:hypothetical protein